MYIKKLRVRHFRGISCLDWDVDGRFVCFIGPGDSTKSTILEAVELALTPRRNVAFDDTDFHNADTNNPILIEITIGGIPIELLSESKFGYMVKGWNEIDGIRDEPQGEDQPLLTIQLMVDGTLEPTWRVVNDRHPEGMRISSFDRAKFGVLRIRDYTEGHLSWGPGSVLTRLMEEREDVRSVLTAARRHAKASLNLDQIPIVTQSAKSAESIGKRLGVAPRTETGFVPNIDVRSGNMGASILSLYDGSIPMRQAGLGSSRLLTIGLQHEAGNTASITLIDEIEYGLEPHRVRRLLGILRRGTRLRDTTDGEDSINKATNQILITTHAPVVLSELEPADMRVVRSDNGHIDIKKPDDDLRPLLRTNPGAFLSRKVIVCEGKTEVGLCRVLDIWWSDECSPFAYIGAALADGQGNTKGPSAAVSLTNLGYSSCFFGDSDEPLNPDETILNKAGVCTILWEGKVSTEERIVLDLPWEGFVEMAHLAIEEFGEDNVQTKLAFEFGCRSKEVPSNPEDWSTFFSSENEIRSAFAKAAKKKKAEWFKRVDRAEKLGELIIRYWNYIAQEPLGIGITRLKDWVYD